MLSEITRVYPLKFAIASELADTLNRLFRGETRGGGGGRRSTTGIGAIFGLGGLSSTDASDPLQQLRDITVVADTKTNSLLVTGPPNSAALMKDLLTYLDKRTAQVFIEVAIVDVTLSKNTKFGVEWQWNDISTSSSGKITQHDVSTNFNLDKETLGLKYSVLNDNLDILLHALKTKNNVKVLSTPTITTADNVEAKISIGQDQPFISSETETTGGNLRRTVDFKNIAIALTVTPHVNNTSNYVALDVHQTINEIIGTEPELNAPIIANREALTSISVRDGQTIVIGGIIKENRDRAVKGVPILSSIPLIGELFKTRDNRSQRSELMVFLTPHILKHDDDNGVTDITNKIQQILSVPPPSNIIENKEAKTSEKQPGK